MFAFFGFALVLIPLPWHLESWNVGTCLYMIWTGLACLCQFVNSIVWRSDVINRAPVWCDISTRIMIGSAVAIPACSLCINRRLYHIASVSSVTKTRAERRRGMMVDFAIGLGLPVLEMVLQYIVQGHRFNIFEEIGCYPFTYNTPPAYALVFCWPVAIGLISIGYCVLTVRELAIRRAQFLELLSANRNLSSGRYFRLMGLASIEVLCTVPLGAYSIYLNVTTEPIEPWISWENVHVDFSHVNQVPSIIWRQTPEAVTSLELSRWSVVICAFIFFGFFGFADEAKKHYRLAYTSAAKRLGLSTGSFGLTTNGTNPDMMWDSKNGAIPVFVSRNTERKRDSFASFSTNISLGDFGGALDDVKDAPPYSPAESSGSIPVLPKRPEPTLDPSSAPRHKPDTPEPVSQRNSIEEVV